MNVRQPRNYVPSLAPLCCFPLLSSSSFYSILQPIHILPLFPFAPPPPRAFLPLHSESLTAAGARGWSFGAYGGESGDLEEIRWKFLTAWLYTIHALSMPSFNILNDPMNQASPLP